MCRAVARGWGPTAAEPSPKLNVYVAIGVPSLSVEPDASALTPSGMKPDSGVTTRDGAGAESTGVTSMVWLVVDERPAVSVTVTVTENVPPLAYVCWAVAPAWGPAVAPSPKSNV